MATPISDAKLTLRGRVLEQMKQTSETTRRAGAAQACALLAQQSLWKQARSVLFYAPLPNELDVWPLLVDAINARKTVALPRFMAETNQYAACQIRDAAKDLTSGQFGIREPAEHCRPLPMSGLDFILTPGVAFDLQGRRLGRGKGFYDLLLAVVRGKTCGVAFDEQIVSEIPVEPHDVPVNCILTPTRWIEL